MPIKPIRISLTSICPTEFLPHDEDEISDLTALVEKAQGQGVHTLADLSTKIFSRAEYDILITLYDWKD
jgi:hypothetical protein